MNLPKSFQSFVIAFKFHDYGECIHKPVLFDQFCDSCSDQASGTGEDFMIGFHVGLPRFSSVITAQRLSRNDCVTSVRIAKLLWLCRSVMLLLFVEPNPFYC